MRILFVTAGYLPESVGGVELHIAGLARAMTAAGHDCAVLARTGRPGLEHLASHRDEVDGVPVLRLANHFDDATTLEGMIASPEVARAAMDLVVGWEPEVVHVHHLTCLSTALLDLLAAAGLPTVMTLHDFWMGCPRGQRITADLQLCPEIDLLRCRPCLTGLWPHLLGAGRDPQAPPEQRDADDLALLRRYHDELRRRLLAVDALLTPSAFMAAMYEQYGLPKGSVRVVENGLPTVAWAGCSRPAREHGPLRVGFIGSVLPSKGVHLALSAFRRLADPSALRLDVWGEVLPFHHDQSYAERLEALRSGYEHVIHLRGAYDNEQLPEILSGLDLLVVPSIWYEAFCLTIREAFLAGVPVLAANHGAMAEAIEDGVTGLLFEAGDPESLAAGLRRLIDDPVLRERLSHNAERVRDEGDAAAELLSIYAGLMERRGGPRP